MSMATRDYKYRLGEIDAFRLPLPVPAANFVYSGVDEYERDLYSIEFVGAYGFSKYYRMRREGSYAAITTGNRYITDIDASVFCLITNTYGNASSPTIDFYYRMSESESSTWNHYSRIDLRNCNSSQILLGKLGYNTYEIKIVVQTFRGDPMNFFGIYTKGYTTPTYEIQDFAKAFQFEINPTTFSQSFGDNGMILSSLNGTLHRRAVELNGSQINVHFDFLRGISDEEAYRFLYELELYGDPGTAASLASVAPDKKVGNLSHADRYKIEYFANSNAKLLLVTDEYEDETRNDFGRNAYYCRIMPGSLKFTRLPIRKGDGGVPGNKITYQESYSCDFTLAILDSATSI